jgi:hypothetical protein
MTAVFDTNELIHLIIEAVPTEHRTSLLRVSKAWKAAILKLGHVLEPIGYESRFSMGASNPGYLCTGLSPLSSSTEPSSTTPPTLPGESPTFTPL